MKLVIERPMPTREQRIAEIDRKIAAGEPLGANHVGKYTNVGRTINCSLNYDPGYLTKRGNPK